MSSVQWTQGSYVVARQIATVVSRNIGELSKEKPKPGLLYYMDGLQ